MSLGDTRRTSWPENCGTTGGTPSATLCGTRSIASIRHSLASTRIIRDGRLFTRRSRGHCLMAEHSARLTARWSASRYRPMDRMSRRGVTVLATLMLIGGIVSGATGHLAGIPATFLGIVLSVLAVGFRKPLGLLPSVAAVVLGYIGMIYWIPN